MPALKKEFKENGFVARELRKRWIPGETIYFYECTRLIGERVRGEAMSEAGLE